MKMEENNKKPIKIEVDEENELDSTKKEEENKAYDELNILTNPCVSFDKDGKPVMNMEVYTLYKNRIESLVQTFSSMNSSLKALNSSKEISVPDVNLENTVQIPVEYHDTLKELITNNSVIERAEKLDDHEELKKCALDCVRNVTNYGEYVKNYVAKSEFLIKYGSDIYDRMNQLSIENKLKAKEVADEDERKKESLHDSPGSDSTKVEECAPQSGDVVKES